MIVGWGYPDAVQLRVASLPSWTVVLLGAVVISGGTELKVWNKTHVSELI